MIDNLIKISLKSRCVAKYNLFSNYLRHRVKQDNSLAQFGWYPSNPAPHSSLLAGAHVAHPEQNSVVISPLSQHFGFYKNDDEVQIMNNMGSCLFKRLTVILSYTCLYS